MLYNQAPPTGERCRSGRTGLSAKQLHGLKPVPRVRIPLSPPTLLIPFYLQSLKIRFRLLVSVIFMKWTPSAGSVSTLASESPQGRSGDDGAQETRPHYQENPIPAWNLAIHLPAEDKQPLRLGQ